MLALFGAEEDDEGDDFFGEFGCFEFAGGFFAGFAADGSFRFSFGHVGGDCIAILVRRNGIFAVDEGGHLKVAATGLGDGERTLG